MAEVLRAFPLEYLYGSLAADFFVGKGDRTRKDHPHNWETGFSLLDRAQGKKESAYALGFLSHLAADVIAHNYFVPTLIYRGSTWKRMGHLYWEATADHHVGPSYMRMARDLLSKDELICDDLLRSAVKRRRRGIRARRHLYTQSVKLSDFLGASPGLFWPGKDPETGIPMSYLVFMLELSRRVVRDFLRYPESSPCLSFDPIGSRNLRLASQNALLTKFFNIPRPVHHFDVDKKLLAI